MTRLAGSSLQPMEFLLLVSVQLGTMTEKFMNDESADKRTFNQPLGS